MTSELPWPLNSGGHLRTFHLLRALAERLDVRLVTPAPPEHVDEGAEALASVGVEPVILSARRTIAHESVKALKAAIDQEPYVLFARHRRAPVLDTLREQIGRQAPSVLYLDHLDSIVYASELPAVPLVVDMHNVYSRLAARMATESGVVRRQYLQRESGLLENMERRAAEIAHTVLAVSEDEADYFQSLGARHVVVVPNGVDCDAYTGVPAGGRAADPTMLFVGSLCWPPNAHAVRFLATTVLPEVRKRIPSARLVVVGRDPGPEILALASPERHVEVAANVDDVAPYYQCAHALVVPLESGGGTRLKILEAFAAGVPVLSTPIGCEGIKATPGSHLLVADHQDFAAAAINLLSRPDRARVLAVRARVLARERYDWRVVGRLACEAVAGAAATSGSPLFPAPAPRRPGAWMQ